MFSSRVPKVIFIFLGLSVLTIGFLVLWLAHDLPKTKWSAAAQGSGVPLRGWAWTDTIGWISFNCRDNDTDANCKNNGRDYWVGVEENNGQLSGYAWSDNVGWIDFGPSDTSVAIADLNTSFLANCPASCDLPSWTCSSCYNSSSRKFFGWARVLAEADSNDSYDTGWIKLDSLIIDGTDFGSKVSKFNNDDDELDVATGLPKGGAPWGDLSGWAWNGANANLGSNSTSGIGWISFNCNNPNAGGCVNSQYQVTGRPKDLGDLHIQRTEGNESYGLNVDWSNGFPAYGATWYEVWRQNSRCAGASGGDCDNNDYCADGSDCELQPYQRLVANSVGSFYQDKTPPLEMFVTYNYVVRACNIFACSKTIAKKLKTSPVEKINIFKATPICSPPNTSPLASFVDINWSAPYIVSIFKNTGGLLTKYDLEYCKLDVTNDISKCAVWTPAEAGCDNLGSDKTSCREILLSTADPSRYRSKDFYVYRIRGVANKGTCLGGIDDGDNCVVNSDCASNNCDLYKSTWSFSDAFRVCPVGTSYQEQRPQ